MSIDFPHRIGTPSLPSEFSEVVTSLQNDSRNLDPAYQRYVVDPIFEYLDELVGIEYTSELDPEERDMIRCLRVNGQTSMNPQTRVVQRLIQGIYNRCNSISPISGGVNLPALHFWGPKKSIYTLPRSFLDDLEIRVRIVAFPEIHRFGEVMGWSSFAHFITGLALLDVHPEILEESKEKIVSKLKALLLPWGLIQYFKNHWENVVADVLGFLNLGPGSIGVMHYLYSFPEEENSPLLPNILRFLLQREVMENLQLQNCADENLPDCFELDGKLYATSYIYKAIQCIAKELCLMPLDALQKRSLSKIRAWNVEDSCKMMTLGLAWKMNTASPIQQRICDLQTYSVEQILSAAVLSTLDKAQDPQKIFTKMTEFLSVADIQSFS